MLRLRPERSLRGARHEYWLAIALLGLLFAVSAAPSPLYSVYQERWHFSSAILTAVFAVYSGTVMLALNLFGAMSDTLGRRRLVVAGLVLVFGALVLFALARNVVWVLAARALQGFGVGTASVALAATIVDSRSTSATDAAATASTVASTLAMAIGSLVAGLFVEYVADARVSLFVVLAALVALSLAAAGRIPDRERAVARSAGASRTFRVRVPRERWTRFALYGAGLAVAWAVGGLYLSLGPSISESVSHGGSRLDSAIAVVILGGVGSGTTFFTRRWSERRLISTGTPPLVAGLLLVVAACLIRSDPLFLAGSAVLASGWGLVNIGTYRALIALSEEGRRAELVAAIYLVSYIAFSVPILLAGVASDHFGLRSTTVVFGIATAAISLATAAVILALDRVGHRSSLGGPVVVDVGAPLCSADRKCR
jgi:MFS family permease